MLEMGSDMQEKKQPSGANLIMENADNLKTGKLKGYFIVMIKFKMSLHAFVDRVSATS
jgi:hypothetical protein